MGCYYASEYTISYSLNPILLKPIVHSKPIVGSYNPHYAKIYSQNDVLKGCEEYVLRRLISVCLNNEQRIELTIRQLWLYNVTKIGSTFQNSVQNIKMNKSCFACDQPAQRVCYHQSCDINPFLCGGDCLDGENQSSMAHTHGGKSKFLPYENVLSKVNNIANSVGLTENINRVAKRVEIIVGDLQWMMKRYQDQLTKRELKLTKTVSEGINNFVSNQNDNKITGKHVNCLITETHYYDNETHEQKAIEIVQRQMNSIIGKLQNLKLAQFLNFEKARSHIKEGSNLASQHKLTQSLKQFENAVKANPFQQKYKKKVEQCKTWIKNQQKYFATIRLSEQHFNASSILFGMGKYQAAIQETQKAISLNPNNPYFYQNIGLNYFTLKQYDKAIEAVSTAIEIKNDAFEFYFSRADCYRAMEKYKEGIENINKSLELNNQYPESYNIRGICYYSLREYQKAVSDYSKAIQLTKTSPTLYINRAQAYFELQQYEKEFCDYQFVIKELKFKCQLSYSRRSDLNFYFYRFREALSDIQEAIKISPKPEYLSLQSRIQKEIDKIQSHKKLFPHLYPQSSLALNGQNSKQK